MATLDLLVVNDRLADGVSGPFSVDGISELVGFTFKHGDGDFNVFNRNEICFPVLANVKVLVVIGGPHLESVFFHVLSVQKYGLDRSAVRLVVHVDLEAVEIVCLRIRRDDSSLESSAEVGNCIAEKLGCPVGEPGLAQ